MVKALKLLSVSIFTLLFLSVSAGAQTYGEKSFYILDSVQLDLLVQEDKNLLDTVLNKYHQGDPIRQLELLDHLANNLYNEALWPRYNELLLQNAQALYSHLGKEDATEKKITLELIGAAYNNVGYVYDVKGNIQQALKYYHKCLTISEFLKDSATIAGALNNIGFIHDNLGDVDRALAFYEKSLAIKMRLNSERPLSTSYNNIGKVYKKKGELNIALDYFLKALKINTKLNFTEGIALVSINIGGVYDKLKDREKSLLYLSKGLRKYEEMGNKEGQGIALQNIGKCHFTNGDYGQAKVFAYRAYAIAQELKYPSNLMESSRLLYRIHLREKKYKEALEMHTEFVLMKDSLNSEKNQRDAATKLTKYKYEKQIAIDETQHEKLLAIQQAEKKKQQIISYAVAFCLILVVIFLYFVFNRLKITRKQKVVIEEQTKEIVDSINYAKRIQDAILPTSEMVKEVLPLSFVFYQPKDIVAGDFYWIDQHGDEVLFASADCTGHGVPGAMVSVVCHTALNRVVREYQLIDPAEILDKTREIVTEQLSKSTESTLSSMSNMRDGMDIALCLLNVKTNELHYAGAHNPLWIVRNEGSEIEEIKATKQAIGKVEHPVNYQLHKTQLAKGDTIYLFSDGYADQFGGPKGKKLMYKPFKRFLISIQDQNMEDQLNSVKQHFNTWKGNLEQVDDVCVMGIRI